MAPKCDDCGRFVDARKGVLLMRGSLTISPYPEYKWRCRKCKKIMVVDQEEDR